MTVRTEPLQPRNFVSATLPWLVAAAALVVYLLTLNHWVSFANMQTVARLSGESWRPEVYGPLYYLLTYPLQWLPVKWIPLGLNAFSMLCSVLVLALLARSVALLPHDRTQEQRLREKSIFSMLSIPQAWIPPVLAAAALGLQLTFWEHATNGTSEMLDLLVFSYVVRCLLEFRLDERESWLYRASLVYGLGLTSNWAMTGFLPVFIGALIWIRGMSFFDWRFLLRMALLALAGMSLYFLLPLAAPDDAPVSFWQLLKANLTAPKNILQLIWRGVSKNVLLLLAVPSLIPLLVISIRWASQFGDSSRIGVGLATWLFHLMHGALLGTCLWVMFDPAFSPRSVSERFPFSFLTLYYLSALSIGYLAGYFLLVFRPLTSRAYRSTPLNIALHRASAAAVWTLLLVVPLLLAFKNLPEIRMSNGPAVEQYADILTRELPGRAVVLSDDDRKLQLARASLIKTGRAGSYILVDTASLRFTYYHAFLEKKHGADWPDLPEGLQLQQVPDTLLQRMVVQLAQRQPVYYLHPSFGYYFEVLYAEPHGLVNELKPYPTDALLRPPIPDDVVAGNEAFWNEISPAIETLAPFASEPLPANRTGFRSALRERLKVRFSPNVTAQTLAQYYARSLDAWGVELQRAGEWEPAAERFEQALRLAPDNLSAEVNLEFNKQRQAGLPSRLRRELNPEQLGTFERVLNRFGPIDEPNLCFEQGRRYAQNNLFRQSLQLFDRVTTLAPDHLRARLALAQLYVPFHRADEALKAVRDIRSHPGFPEESGVGEADVLRVELSAHFSRTNLAEVDRIVQTTIRRRVHDDAAMGALVQVCAMFGSISNAFDVLEHQLRAKTNHVGAMANKGVLLSQLGRYDEALETFNQAMRIQPNNHGLLLNRAITHLLSGQLDEAQADYETLARVMPRQHQIYYGLAEVALRKQQTNTAIGYYERYLTNAPVTRESLAVRERLRSLKEAAP